MRTTATLLGICLCAGLMGVACEQEAEDTTAVNETTTFDNTVDPKTTDDFADRAERTVDGFGDWAASTKDQVATWLRREYEALDAKIAELRNDAAASGDNAEDGFDDAMDNLQAQRRAFDAKWQEFQNASGDTWRTMKDGVSEAWENLKQAYDDAAAYVDDRVGE